jgi:hypothetical protein
MRVAYLIGSWRWPGAHQHRCEDWEAESCAAASSRAGLLHGKQQLACKGWQATTKRRCVKYMYA